MYIYIYNRIPRAGGERQLVEALRGKIARIFLYDAAGRYLRSMNRERVVAWEGSGNQAAR